MQVSLESQLEQYRYSWHDFFECLYHDSSSFYDYYGCNVLSDSNNVKGKLAECYVKKWLSNANIEDEIFDDNTKDPLFEKTSDGIIVKKNNVVLHEYDFIVSYDSNPYSIEVKSGKLHSYQLKIPRALKYVKEKYGFDVPLRIILPLKTCESNFLDGIKENYNHDLVDFIDLGITRKELSKTSDDFFDHISKIYK